MQKLKQSAIENQEIFERKQLIDRILQKIKNENQSNLKFDKYQNSFKLNIESYGIPGSSADCPGID